MKHTHENTPPLRTVYRILSVAVCLTMIAVLVAVVSWMPRFGDSDNPADNEVYERYVEEGTEEAGAVNTVADMILDYRAFDTLGESNVLFAAACIVLILLQAERDPKDGRYLIPELHIEPPEEKKDSILRGAAAVLLPAGMLYGISMILNGHLSAGGGFSGGAVTGAALILSAHTDLPLIREALNLIGYYPDREEPCFCAGRYYLLLRARPGKKQLTHREIRLGGPLFESASDQLIPYLTRRRDVLADKLRGLLSADSPDESLIAEVRSDIAFYNEYINHK